MYQGFSEKYFILVISSYISKLKIIRKLGVSVQLIKQRCFQVDLFALKSDFYAICLILIYILI